MLLWIFLLYFVSSVQGGWDQMTKKYQALKTMVDCFGEEFLAEEYRNYSEALHVCKSLSPETFLRELPLTELSFADPTVVPETSPLRPLIGNFPSPAFFDPPSGAFPSSSPPAVVNLNDLVSNFSQPMLLVPLPYSLLEEIAHLNAGGIYIRKKRDTGQLIFDEKKISDTYRKIQAQSGNFTCIVKNLGLFNDDFDVNVKELMDRYSGLNLDQELRHDINDGILDCIKFSTCKPLNHMSLIPPAVQRAMTFLKCESKQRTASCIKSDMQRFKHQFDIDALDDIPAGMNMDEADKMMAIMFGEFMRPKF